MASYSVILFALSVVSHHLSFWNCHFISRYRVQPPLAVCTLTRLFVCGEAFNMLLPEGPKGCNGYYF